MQTRRTARPATPALRLRRVAIAVAGFSVLLLGVALLVVPVPGTSVFILALGLAILAREFLWARRLRDWSIANLKRTWAGVRAMVRRAAHGPGVAPLPLTAQRARVGHRAPVAG
jgi:hypothetical protein